MKAVVKFADGMSGVACHEKPVPEPGKGEIRIKVLAAGICGTDLHIAYDEYPCNRPVTLGHEYVGTVDKLGEGVDQFSPGQTVVSLACAYVCESCEFCAAGTYMMCEERRSIGSGVDGAMAEYVIVPADKAFAVQREASLELALTEPVACCVRAVSEIGGVNDTHVVFISGPGFMGQMIMQVAKRLGAKVVLSGIPGDEARLALAKSLGADYVCTNVEDIKAAFESLSVSSADIAFECAGVAASLSNCIANVKKQGSIIQVGLFGKPVPVDLDLVLRKEIQIKTSFGSNTSTWKKTLQMVEEEPFVLHPYISRVFAPEDIQDAFKCAEDKSTYKTLISFSK